MSLLNQFKKCIYIEDVTVQTYYTLKLTFETYSVKQLCIKQMYTNKAKSLLKVNFYFDLLLVSI